MGSPPLTARAGAVARILLAFESRDLNLIPTLQNKAEPSPVSGKRRQPEKGLRESWEGRGTPRSVAKLGIPASTLESKIKQLGIEKRRFASAP